MVKSIARRSVGLGQLYRRLQNKKRGGMYTASLNMYHAGIQKKTQFYNLPAQGKGRKPGGGCLLSAERVSAKQQTRRE